MSREQSFDISRLSTSKDGPLPLSTPAKAVRWDHNGDPATLVLTSVQSRLRLQVKREGQAVISDTFSRLTPAQKRAADSPRVQYQDARVSFRYPPSSSTNKNLADRFQIHLTERSDVAGVIDILGPFFAIMAPTSLKGTPAATSATPSSTLGKRKAGAASDDSQPPSAKPRTDTAFPSSPSYQQASTDVHPISHQAPVDDEARLGLGKRLDEGGELSLHRTSPVSSPAPSVPAASADIALTSPETSQGPSVDDTLRLALLRGYGDRPSDQILHQQTTQSPRSPATLERLVDPSAPLTKRKMSPFHTTSPRRRPPTQEDELDLLPRSPLVDDSEHPVASHSSPLPSAMRDLVGLTFDAHDEQMDGLLEMYPMLPTRAEEMKRRERLRSDNEDWDRDALLDSDSPGNELRRITSNRQQEDGKINQVEQDHIFDWEAASILSDQHLKALIDSGWVSEQMLAFCYRIVDLNGWPPLPGANTDFEFCSDYTELAPHLQYEAYPTAPGTLGAYDPRRLPSHWSLSEPFSQGSTPSSSTLRSSQATAPHAAFEKATPDNRSAHAPFKQQDRPDSDAYPPMTSSSYTHEYDNYDHDDIDD